MSQKEGTTGRFMGRGAPVRGRNAHWCRPAIPGSPALGQNWHRGGCISVHDGTGAAAYRCMMAQGQLHIGA